MSLIFDVVFQIQQEQFSALYFCISVPFITISSINLNIQLKKLLQCTKMLFSGSYLKKWVSHNMIIKI